MQDYNEEKLYFEIPIAPMAKNSTKFGQGRAYTPQAVRDTEMNIKNYVRSCYKGFPLDGPLGLKVIYWRPRSRSIRKKKVFASTKPDEDNYTKLLKDSLEGVLWKNDSRICDGRYIKKYTDGPGRIELTVWLLKE